MSAASVDIVIVNWNAGPLLRECVTSISREAGDLAASVVVVDNGSTDGSARLSDDGLPLIIDRAGSNLGFARACNRGAARGSAPYLLFLNPDAQIGPRSLHHAVEHLESERGTSDGICGVQLLGADHEVQRHCGRFPTASTLVATALGLTSLAPGIFRPVMLGEFDHRSSRHVEHVIGAFYLIRREVFESLGGFDERFFVYLEDLDLSQRVAQAGWGTYYLVGAPSLHVGGGTSSQVKAHRLFYANQSRLVYAFKHFGRVGAWAVAAATLIVEPWVRLARSAVRGSRADAVNTLKAYRMLWEALPRVLASKDR
ncbi:glycosyltransferase family 2 protein [Qipengyuania sp. MTN3-11]|uniref:glycosyltransferase family 2 protein n=1 Tax=Qipengyuania sp. MTN3-11 TaxID=3056557 RepID=UPI0036F1B6D0